MDQINSRIGKVSKLDVGLLTGKSLVHNLWTFLWLSSWMRAACCNYISKQCFSPLSQSQITPLKAFF